MLKEVDHYDFIVFISFLLSIMPWNRLILQGVDHYDISLRLISFFLGSMSSLLLYNFCSRITEGK